ncbi:MAG: EI24 domain-containing protein [Flavobacteriales bacterium]|nr:EI24 domain-containing protein [Flavobacteriales bacterium]
MNPFQAFRLGISTYITAHRFIVRHRLWGYILFPGLINLALFIIFAWFAWTVTGQWMTAFEEWTGLQDTDSGAIFWIHGTLTFLLSFLLRMLMVMIYLSIYRYIMLILLSPLLALLSEKVDEILTGNRYPFSFSRLLKDAARGSLLAIRNAFRELILSLLVYALAFVPVAGMASPFLIVIIESYFCGFSMIDYSLERKRMNLKNSIHYVRRHRWVGIANGLAFHFIYLLPFIGWVIAPTYGVVAATLAVHELDKNNNA